MTKDEAVTKLCDIAKALAVLGVDSETLAYRVKEYDGESRLRWVDDVRKCGEALLGEEGK